MAEMPGPDRLLPVKHGWLHREVALGEAYDSTGALAWDIPRSVEPFLSTEWIKQVRS